MQVYSDALGRNDHSLMHYGFIHRENNPRMTCMDRPGGDLYDDNSCPLNDSDYGGYCPKQNFDSENEFCPKTCVEN